MPSVSTIGNINGYTTPMGNRALSIKKLTWTSGTLPALPAPFAAFGGFQIFNQTFALRGIDWANSSDLSSLGNQELVIVVPKIGGSVLYVMFSNPAARGTFLASGASVTADSAPLIVVGG